MRHYVHVYIDLSSPLYMCVLPIVGILLFHMCPSSMCVLHPPTPCVSTSVLLAGVSSPSLQLDPHCGSFMCVLLHVCPLCKCVLHVCPSPFSFKCVLLHDMCSPHVCTPLSFYQVCPPPSLKVYPSLSLQHVFPHPLSRYWLSYGPYTCVLASVVVGICQLFYGVSIV